MRLAEMVPVLVVRVILAVGGEAAEAAGVAGEDSVTLE